MDTLSLSLTLASLSLTLASLVDSPRNPQAHTTPPATPQPAQPQVHIQLFPRIGVISGGDRDGDQPVREVR